jgi:hydroxyacylglutathione hydrolase
MLFRLLFDDKLAAASYLIGCQKTGQAIVIDPQRDIDRYTQFAAAEGLKIIAATETHLHADFLSGLRELAESGVKVYASDEGGPDWKYQWLGQKSTGGSYDYQLLHDGNHFQVGNIDFQVVHTPGHTPEHICFLVTDKGGGASEPMGIATGDFVFVGDLGRPDLLESAAGMQGAADSSAHQLYRSIGKFNALPDFLQVWPAHGAGSACGKALGAVPQTTVGYEKRFNPSLRAADSEQHFVDFILSGQPEPPLYFARMKRDNKLGPKVLHGLPRPQELSAQDLTTLNASKIALIDTRPWDTFKSGHLSGALFFPLNRSFSTDTGAMIDGQEEIYLLLEPEKLDEALRALVRVGLDNIRGYITPATFKEFVQQGGKLATTPDLTVKQAEELVADPKTFILDVRGRNEYSAGHFPTALNITHTRLASRLAEIPHDKPLLVHCRSGTRSARACALLQKHGYSPANLAGGYLAWEQSHSA